MFSALFRLVCSVTMNSDCVIVTIITEDVRIKFDNKKTVMLSMNRQGSPEVQGLCGNHNQDDTGDEMLNLR